MKLNALRLRSIACLLLIASVSHAADVLNGNNSKNNARVTVDKLSDTTDYEGDIHQGGSSRSIGAVLANKSVSPVDPDKKRIQELEDIVLQQQKLIEMYKKQANH
jgi:hypothetical protein